MSSNRETFVGRVTDNEDPEQRGRIKVACAALMGVDDNGDPVEYPAWVPPRFPMTESTDGEIADSGFFFVPNVGTTVEFQITIASSFDQSPGQASISNPDPRWLGCVWNPADELNEDFTTNYPNRQGWRTRTGHLLMFDQTEDDEKIILRHGGTGKDGAGSFMSFTKEGNVIIATEGGQMIYINDEDGEVTVLDKNSNLIGLNSDGITLAQGGSGQMIDMNDQGVFITVAGNCTVTANDVTLSAGSVNLGATAIESVIKGQTFQTLFNAHTHPTGVGPSGPPVVPLTGAELSLVTKTE